MHNSDDDDLVTAQRVICDVIMSYQGAQARTYMIAWRTALREAAHFLDAGEDILDDAPRDPLRGLGDEIGSDGGEIVARTLG